jgi:hypothetical protein
MPTVRQITTIISIEGSFYDRCYWSNRSLGTLGHRGTA